MKNLVNSWYHIAGTAVLTLWCCLAQADDIEVYRGGDSGLRSSAMIVMDTSGSMSYWVIENTPDYEPATNYSVQYAQDADGDNIDYPFDENLYYFSDQYSGGELSNSDITNLENRPFPPSALACSDAIEVIKSAGFYSNKFKRWNTSTNIWDPSVDVRVWGGWWGWYILGWERKKVFRRRMA